MRCRDCGVRPGRKHLPSCRREGIVNALDSDAVYPDVSEPSFDTDEFNAAVVGAFEEFGRVALITGRAIRDRHDAVVEDGALRGGVDDDVAKAWADFGRTIIDLLAKQ